MPLVKCSLILALFFISYLANCQSKAFVIDNVWDNDLNNYNPRMFYENLFTTFKSKLLIKDFVADPTRPSIRAVDANWDKKLKSLIVERHTAADSIFYIALSTQLKLPTFNIGRLIFKNPPRSSKLIFTYHVYNGVGDEIIGDTIINRGCLTRSLEEGKDSRFFYLDYNSFNSDLNCHLRYIKTQLDEKFLEKRVTRIKQ